VARKWLLDQDGFVAIPKAQRPASQETNLDAMAWSLDDDRRIIAAGCPSKREA
jgi:2,5-diketo-D-gluconate reductase B